MITLFMDYQLFVVECHEYGVPAPPVPEGFAVPGGVTIDRDPRLARAPRRAGRRLRCVATLPKRKSKPPPGPYYERPED